MKIYCGLQEKYYTQMEIKKAYQFGNYTSQCFANICLEEAIENLEKTRDFLKENLELELNKKTQIFKSTQGVNFCGYKINEYRLKIRDKGKRKLKQKVKHLTKQVKQGKISSKEAHKYLAGHMGYIKIANVKNLTGKLFYNDLQ